MSKTRCTVLGLLVFLIVGAATSPQASAHGPLACIHIQTPPFTGGYENNCATLEPNGNGHYALAIALGVGAAARWWACEKVNNGGTKYSNHLCLTQQGGGAWERVNTGLVPRELGSTKSTVLKGTVAGAAVEGTCAEDSFKDEPQEATTSKGTLELAKCTVNKPAKCTVAEPIVGNFTEEIVETSTKLLANLTGSGAAHAFVEIEFKNKGAETCALNGQKPVLSGTQQCEFDKGVKEEVEAFHEEQEMVCPTSKSSLKLAGSPATLALSGKVMIEEGSAWAVL